MSKLRFRKKLGTIPPRNPNLGDDDPCWCGSGTPYFDCHKLWDEIRDRKEEPMNCVKPGQ